MAFTLQTINYAEDYQRALEQEFPYVLYFGALFATPNNGRYQWINSNTIKVPTISTSGRVDGDRDTIGTRARHYNTEWATLALENHRTWMTLVHPRDIDETNQVASIANITRVYNDEQKFPEMNAYLISKLYADWVEDGNTANTTTLTASNILDVFDQMMVDMDNARVPRAGRILYVTPDTRAILKQAEKIYRSYDVQSSASAIQRGVSSIDEVQIPESVPADMMKTVYDFTEGWAVGDGAAQVNMLLVHPQAVITPVSYEFAQLDPPSAGSQGKWEYFEGQSIVFSMDIKADYLASLPSGYTVSFDIFGSNNSGSSWTRKYYKNASLATDSFWEFNSDDYVDDDWVRVTAKATVPALSDMSTSTTTTYSQYVYGVYIFSGTSNTEGDMSIRKPKLELGTVPTDWTPAPEDVDYAVEIVSDKYATLVTTVDGITGTVGDLETVVGDNYTYFYDRITVVEETADGLLATVSSHESMLYENILADSTFDGYTTFGSSYSWYRPSSTYITISEYDDDVCVCFTRGGSNYYLRQAISLDAGTYVVRAKIACSDDYAPAVRARLGSTYAYLHDSGELSSEWKTYTATITITSEATYYYLYVYATYGSTSQAATECYVTNLAVYEDYSIDYTQSQIQVLSDSISMSVTGSLGDTASIVISANGSEVSTTTLDLSGVRSAFADDTTAVTISAGTITFESGTLVIDADNFKLASDGSAALYGSVYFNNSLYMHFDDADVSDGYYNIIKTEAYDTSYSGIYFGMIDDSDWYGKTFLYMGTDGGFRLRAGGSDVFYAGNTGGINASITFSRVLGTQPQLEDYGYGVFGYNTSNKFYLTWDKSTPALGITVDSTAMYLSYTTSDERLKQNFADIDDALIESVGNAPLLSYNMNFEAYDDSTEYIGTTAQLLIEQLEENGLTTDDARKILAKQTVYTDSDETYWMIDYEQFLLLRIAYDEKRIAALESQLAAYA